ncbi:CIS tube protein [Sorangium sp. So ce1389]|uniref:CIS tube protein n=1 Tax=Sorangium sp. So ce1389 TaxID=3133336 RepID=UPI003F5EF1FE
MPAARSLTKMRITPSSGGGPIDVLFNPTEYTIAQSNQYAEIGVPGLEAPIIQFVRGNSEDLSLELLVDTTDPRAPRDARVPAERLMELARVAPELHAPPVCTFSWGGEILRGVVASANRQFVLFDPDGVPRRIRVTLGVKRYRSLQQQIRDMSRRSPDRTRSVLVREGDTLPAIAAHAYGDPTLWRPIAEHNRIDDPARLTPGRVLEVPPIAPLAARPAGAEGG